MEEFGGTLLLLTTIGIPVVFIAAVAYAMNRRRRRTNVPTTKR